MAPILYVLVLFLVMSDFKLLSLVPVMYNVAPVYWNISRCKEQVWLSVQFA